MPDSYNDQNVQDLGAVLMSEASIGDDAERVAVGWTVLNRMNRNGVESVCDVWSAYAHGQTPTQTMLQLALNLLNGAIADNSNGATHFYSPRAMPKEGESTGSHDVSGGLEQVPGLPVRNYRPGWALTFIPCPVAGARDMYYKFYSEPGGGPVS